MGAIQRAVQFYADLMEETVQDYSFKWFYHEPFIGGVKDIKDQTPLMIFNKLLHFCIVG